MKTRPAARECRSQLYRPASPASHDHVQGFYVNLDYHGNKYTDSLGNGVASIYDQPSWTAAWVQLLTIILQNVPSAQGKLFIDLVNEPDGCALFPQLCVQRLMQWAGSSRIVEHDAKLWCFARLRQVNIVMLCVTDV